MALTHHELCQIAYKFLKRNGFKVCFHDRFVAVTSTGEQPDAMGFRNSASCLIEAKCSRADLLADRKKRFRKNPSLGMGDWRFFISEPEIISVSRRRFINELMQAIAGGRVRRFAGGLRTVAETAVFAQTTVTVRYPVATRRVRWRAGELTDKQNILLKNAVCSHGRITRNPAN